MSVQQRIVNDAPFRAFSARTKWCQVPGPLAQAITFRAFGASTHESPPWSGYCPDGTFLTGVERFGAEPTAERLVRTTDAFGFAD